MAPDAEVQVRDRRWTRLALLGALLVPLVVGALLLRAWLSESAPRAKSPRELAMLAFRALQSNDVEAFEALGPNENDLEYMYAKFQEYGKEREKNWAQRKLEDAGGFQGMEEKHRDTSRRSFQETHEVLAEACHLPVARFVGIVDGRTTLRERMGLDGGDIYFLMIAGNVYATVKLDNCARLKRGWICSRGVHFEDIHIASRDDTSGCSGGRSKEGLEALRAMKSRLDEPASSWMEAAMAPLVSIRDELREHPDQAVRLGYHDVSARIEAVDVIVVSNLHDVIGCQRSFARVLNEYGPAFRAQGRRVIVGLEEIPSSRIERARAVFAAPYEDEGKPVLSFLRECTPWPVSGYQSIAESIHAVGATLIPVGRLEAPTRLPVGDTLDAERRPGHGTEDDVDALRAEFLARNRRVADAVAAALQKEPKGIVLLFYDCAHLLDPEPGFGNLQGLLVERGLEPLFVISFLRDWELAIRESKKQDDWTWWHEVAPSVLRSDCVSDEELLEMAKTHLKR